MVYIEWMGNGINILHTGTLSIQSLPSSSYTELILLIDDSRWDFLLMPHLPPKNFKIPSICKVMSAVQLIGNIALSLPHPTLVPVEPVI